MRIKQILVCFALKEEASPFQKIPAMKPDFPVLVDVSILITGIGRRNAEKSMREHLAGMASVPGNSPLDLVLTCGFAGGLNPELKLGDVVFESGKRKAESGNLDEKLLAAGATPAKIFCADRIATTVAEKKKLRAETGADAVEMESAAIHAVCRERGIPCATIRVISDTASEDLPLDFNTLSKPDKNLDYGKLFLAIAKSPGKIPALMQLQKKTKFAAGQLAEVLARIVFP
jgi:adenosylhomocysteine nucleosidase